MTPEAKAAEILKAHRAAARVAKARKLSPEFDAECRAADRPWYPQTWMETAGWLWGMKWMLLFLGGLAWLFVVIARFLWLMVKWLCFSILLWLLGGFNLRARPYRYYRRRW